MMRSKELIVMKEVENFRNYQNILKKIAEKEENEID
jgi:hypothetical protein